MFRNILAMSPTRVNALSAPREHCAPVSWRTGLRSQSLEGGNVKSEGMYPSVANPRRRRRRWLPVAIASVTALAGGVLAVVTASAASAATVDTSAWYTLINRNSGKALDVCGSATAHGAGVPEEGGGGGGQQRVPVGGPRGGYYPGEGRDLGEGV